MTPHLEDTTIENALKTFEDFYLKKDYPNALLTLEKNQKDIDPSLLHYNSGTVFGEMKNWPMARYHFLLAEMAGMNTKEIDQNKILAEQTLDVPRLEQPLGTSDYLIKTGLIASEGPLLTIGLLFLVIGIWLLKKKPSFKNAMLLIVMVATPLMVDFWIDSWPKKIVTDVKVVHEGPSALFGTRGEIPAGVMVITNTKDGWEEIVYPSRFSGWVKSDAMKALELK